MSKKLRRRMRRLLYHVGHRGAYLLFLAMLDAFYAYAMIADRAAFNFLGHVTYTLPINAWTTIWIVGSVTALIGAFVKKDKLAFAICAWIKMWWAAVFARIMLFSPIHYPLVWINIPIWVGFALITLLIASWPEVYVKNISPSLHKGAEEDKDGNDDA